MLQTAVARVGAFHAAACGRVLVATLLAAVMGACAFATTGERELASDSSVVGSCQRDTVRTALLRAARAWADGDAGALVSLLSLGGKLTYEDVARRIGMVEYRGSELADHMAARVPRKELLVFDRVDPPYSTIPDGESLRAFVLRDGLDYPIMFRGLTDCQHGLVFREVSVAVGGR